MYARHAVRECGEEGVTPADRCERSDVLVSLPVGLREKAHHPDLRGHILMHCDSKDEVSVSLVLRHGKKMDLRQLLRGGLLGVPPIAQASPV